MWLNIPQLTLGNTRVMLPNFQNSIWHENTCMLGYTSLDIICSLKFSFPWVTVHFMLLEKCSLLETDNVPVSNGGWGITGITLNKILKAECITSECVGKFWSKHRLTISPFHYPANNSNSLFIPFISAANHGHFSVPMWSATIASITLFVISWLVSAFELLKVFTKKKKQ